jgi:hypothetical protein
MGSARNSLMKFSKKNSSGHKRISRRAEKAQKKQLIF